MRSMTGYGRSEYNSLLGRISIEIKSINHKYCDVNVKLPHIFIYLEHKIIKAVKEKLTRGRIDVFIQWKGNSEQLTQVSYNESIAGQYYQIYEQIATSFNIPLGVNGYLLGKCPQVITSEQGTIEEDVWEEIILSCLEESIQNHIQSRNVEGISLRSDIEEKLIVLEDTTHQICSRLPQVLEEYKDRLYNNLKDVLEDVSIDEGRIAQEVTLFADKIAIDEEMVRLKTHIQRMKELMGQEIEIGRQLDFIAQEMNREANTTLSKANDLLISQLGITLKTTIEKIREQVQNIE